MKSLSLWLPLCLALTTSPAFAHARLVKSRPANGSHVKSPAHIVLTFSEALEPAFSGALLMDRDGHNLSGEPARISDRRITLTPGHLKSGDYIVSWHSVGDDGHRLEGRLHFHVRP